MQERRSSPRISFSTELWLGEDGVFSRTDERIANVSVRGALLELTGYYAIGAIMSIRFGIDGRLIASTVAIRSVRDGGVGVEFLDLSPDARASLAAFIERRS